MKMGVQFRAVYRNLDLILLKSCFNHPEVYSPDSYARHYMHMNKS